MQKPLVFATLATLSIFASHKASAQYFSLGKGNAPQEFYDTDFSSLADPSKRVDAFDKMHYIPLGWSDQAYLSIGGEFREQFWSQNNEAHALKSPTRNTYDLQRILGDFYLHFDEHLAVFAQVGRFDSFGKTSPSTTDEDYGRLQQGFVELKEAVGPANVTARLGRQEIVLGSGRFVWINDSSNVRTTHDGVRVHSDFANNISLDLVATRPVTSTLDAFTDFDSHAGIFGAAYLSEALTPTGLNLDEYYFFRRNINSQYVTLTGDEDRDTIGGRVWGAIGSFQYDSDFAYQFGTFAAKPISAFGTSTRLLYTFEGIAWQPGLQMQASYFSGTSGGSKAQTIGTFDAPFPRPTLLNYIGLETLENVIEAYPALVLNPTSTVALRFGPEVLWRADTSDAVYISRTTPLTKTVSSTDTASYIGTNMIATLQWKVAPKTTIFAEYLHEFAGPAITLAGGKGADAGVVQIDYNF